MAVGSITKTIDGVRYEFYSVPESLANEFFDIIRHNPTIGVEKVDSVIAKKITNWRSVVNDVVRNHMNTFEQQGLQYTQDVTKRLVNFLTDMLIECDYTRYYEVIKQLQYISAASNNYTIVFCYNNDKPDALKIKGISGAYIKIK